MGTRLTAAQLIEQWADSGSYESWDEPAAPSRQPRIRPAAETDAGYQAQLDRARLTSGVDEAVSTGSACIAGTRTALILSEFEFLGGSLGEVAVRRICSALTRATANRMPVVASPASGGTRMQEGAPAFLHMVDIVRAVEAHKAAGLMFLVYMRDPTTGGALASWGSLGSLTVGEPGALITFVGPRVAQQIRGNALPDESVRAERLRDNGLLDDVLDPVTFGSRLRLLLSDGGRSRPISSATRCGLSSKQSSSEATAQKSAWSRIVASRRPDRPSAEEALAISAHKVLALRRRGHGCVTAAVCRFDGHRCVVIAQDRTVAANGHILNAADLRAARHAVRVAAELRLPIITLVDTPGADVSEASEEEGIAGEIAGCLAELASAHTPSLGVLLGQGCGAGALALLGTDTMLAADDSWLSPLPVEGASVILFGDPTHAAELADKQAIAATALAEHGLIDGLIPGSHVGRTDFIAGVRSAVMDWLGGLSAA